MTELDAEILAFNLLAFMLLFFIKLNANCSLSLKLNNHNKMLAKKTIIHLPNNYHYQDFLAYHSRDKQNVAEIITNNQLRKGITCCGQPAELTFILNKNSILVSLQTDNPAAVITEQQLEKLAKNMLSLYQSVELFEDKYHNHPVIGNLISRQQGLRVYQAATAFEAITWAIIGQQISVAAAIAIRRRFIHAFGKQHSSGIWCFPSFYAIHADDEQKLRICGFSIGKAKTLIALCNMLKNNHHLLNLPVDENNLATWTQKLSEIKGIGPWTISYSLLRGFNYLNGSLHGDVAVQRNLQYLLNCSERISAKETEKWLAQYSPWKALVAAHLWQQQSNASY
ncbi:MULTISPECIES: 3-methyladenine DNA glycosylase 2 [unclassified Arsenophonus]|uniref:DNA-3-methyladenine glycosylase family protein n=1 Tax=unclassified Arsenophonus TaxID=2627083 RepID=UPI002863241A|nr:3-methyladenine DNA glycosylase 2 [Arsenophonus sp.]MDR5610276.1 3-methyladenine DNA glycosylase 2 [Arsenophonus sp.]MDR5614070.1 3-methyladenine DNA glycosylase 2 [Arsenophonus sp.]